MIITETVSSPVISNIAALPSRFKIKASAKAFKILSGFYSEPILAIPRELGANAWDSHVKAKNTDKMFEVHAPNTLEPWFSVRDFGTGLSTDAIDSIYTTYFESTKTSDNDSDGCMGLGSKTPFNYTDNFNVTSWYHGKKHVYNCFIDETGSPNIMHVVSEDSNEPNGLEVKFGVKIADIGMWVTNITRAYEPFRYRPIIKGANITYTERKYAHQGNGWGYRNPEVGYHYNTRGSYAFMGNYCYPISTSAIRSALYLDRDNGYTYEQALSHGGFDFFFDIGALEVAPNKEQLQYEENNSTTLAIVAAIKIAVTELKGQVLKSIEVPKSRWEAMKLYEKYNNYNSPYANIRSIIGSISIKFNNKEVTNNNVGVVGVHRETGCIDDKTTLPAEYSVYTVSGPSARFKRTGSYHSNNSGNIYYTNGVSVKSARLRHHLKNKYNTGTFPTCYVIVDLSNKNETFLKHKEYFGWADDMVTNIESLPKPPVTPRQKKTAGTDEIQVANISHFIKPPTGTTHPYVRFESKPATFDSNSTYYYVDFYYFNPTWNNKNISDYMGTVVDIFVNKKLNNSADTIYGINVKNKGLLKVGKWINVVDVVKKYIDANAKEYEQYLYTVGQKTEYLVTQKIQKALTRFPTIITNIENKETTKMFQDFLKANIKVSNADSTKCGFLSILNIKPKNHDTTAFDPKEFANALEKKYLGLFNLDIDYYSNSHATEAISKIINFIDKHS